jgi:hypothetical protein
VFGRVRSKESMVAALRLSDAREGDEKKKRDDEDE